MKIYVVTSGCYSDYYIEKLFLCEEKAKEYASRNYDSEVKIYDTYDECFSTKVKPYYYIILYGDGSCDDNVKEGWGETSKDFEINKYFEIDKYLNFDYNDIPCIADITSYISKEHLMELRNRVWQEYTTFQAMRRGEI